MKIRLSNKHDSLTLLLDGLGEGDEQLGQKIVERLTLGGPEHGATGTIEVDSDGFVRRIVIEPGLSNLLKEFGAKKGAPPNTDNPRR